MQPKTKELDTTGIREVPDSWSAQLTLHSKTPLCLLSQGWEAEEDESRSAVRPPLDKRNSRDLPNSFACQGDIISNSQGFFIHQVFLNRIAQWKFSSQTVDLLVACSDCEAV